MLSKTMNLIAYFQKRLPLYIFLDLVYLSPCLRPFPIFFHPHIPTRDFGELKHRRFRATLVNRESVLLFFLAWSCPLFSATCYKSKEAQSQRHNKYLLERQNVLYDEIPLICRVNWIRILIILSW